MLQDATVVAIIPVKDLGRARTFYEKMLGLVPEMLMEDTGQVMYSCNGTRLMVYQTEASPGEATKAALVVSDLETEMKQLRAHGIVFEDFDSPNLKTTDGVAEMPTHRSAWFKDVDGNYLALTQM